MQNILATERAHRRENLIKVLETGLFAQKLFGVDFAFQSAAVAELVHHVGVVDRGQFLDVADDVGVVDALENLDLVFGKFVQFGDFAEFLDGDAFDGEELLGVHGYGAVDFAVGARADDFLELVAVYYFHCLLIVRHVVYSLCFI